MAINQTLLSIHLCMALAIIIVSIRLALCARRYKHQPPQTQARRRYFDASDILCAVSIPFLVARWALADIVITWGTTNIAGGPKAFKPGEAERRMVGSKCVLASRVAFATFVWCQKGVLLLFYHRLIHHTPWGCVALTLAWFTLFATYAAVQVTTFTECRPFHNYYRILAKPDVCVRAVVQLFVLGILSIFTDLMLIILPIPVVWKIKQPFWQKLQLGFLFSLGFFITLVTAVRVPQNYKNSTKQMNRTLWVSIEILVSAFVANAPTIYGLLRRRHVNKSTHFSLTGQQSHSIIEPDTFAGRTKLGQFSPTGTSQPATPDKEASLSEEEAYSPRTRARP